jgi:HD-GYP domain-containing protein (c-di-GMP phosphodiesterase class II)
MDETEISQTNEEIDSTSESFLALYDAIFEVWSSALDLRDQETAGHTQRVTEMTVKLARRMGINNGELENIRIGSLLHDFGNIAIPESILHKKGELTVDEWITIHLHPYTAYEMLEPIVYLRPALDIPYRHHERWDGSGYPKGLKGEEIPLAARIFSVIDVYDSLTSDRPYRSAWSREDAIHYIENMADKQFDPKVVNAFLQMIRQYDT